MTIKFKILEVHQKENQIIVKYYDDIMTEEKVEDRTTFAVNLPIPTPSGKYLNEFILSKAPTQFFVDAEAVVQELPDFKHINKLIGIEHEGKNHAKEHIRKKSKIKYEKLEFFPEHNTCLVKYWTDEFPEGITLNVGLPLVNGEHPDEVQADKMIMDVAPVNEIDRAIIYKNSPPKIPKHLKPHVKK